MTAGKPGTTSKHSLDPGVGCMPAGYTVTDRVNQFGQFMLIQGVCTLDMRDCSNFYKRRGH